MEAFSRSYYHAGLGLGGLLSFFHFEMTDTRLEAFGAMEIHKAWMRGWMDECLAAYLDGFFGCIGLVGCSVDFWVGFAGVQWGPRYRCDCAGLRG
ncbi:hypothetical protein IQ07DRAFT_306110 [Pyrenochaeta sp. DS3sAY3a]|nr:hypothetical protein IQ07DRAFT_306110 [Pyrenochaeta sp. DS3sAY3a]